MKVEGFFFTSEALLSLLLFSLLFFSFSFSLSSQSLQELYLLQKSDDLLKVWGLERNFSGQELLSDIAFDYPDNCVVLIFKGKPLNNCKSSGRFFSASGAFFDDSLNSFEIKLTVYY